MTAPTKKKQPAKKRPSPQAQAVRKQSQRRASQPRSVTVQQDPVVAQFGRMLDRDLKARDWQQVEADFLWLGHYFESVA